MVVKKKQWHPKTIGYSAHEKQFENIHLLIIYSLKLQINGVCGSIVLQIRLIHKSHFTIKKFILISINRKVQRKYSKRKLN